MIYSGAEKIMYIVLIIVYIKGVTITQTRQDYGIYIEITSRRKEKVSKYLRRIHEFRDECDEDG